MCGLVALSASKLIELRHIDTHAGGIRVFLWCHNHWGAPFGGFCDRSDYALVYEQVDLILKLIPIAKGDGTWGSDAEWRASLVKKM